MQHEFPHYWCLALWVVWLIASGPGAWLARKVTGKRAPQSAEDWQREAASACDEHTRAATACAFWRGELLRLLDEAPAEHLPAIRQAVELSATIERHQAEAAGSAGLRVARMLGTAETGAGDDVPQSVLRSVGEAGEGARWVGTHRVERRSNGSPS